MSVLTFDVKLPEDGTVVSKHGVTEDYIYIYIYIYITVNFIRAFHWFGERKHDILD